MIRLSLERIRARHRDEATQLLSAFALVPENTVCPRGVLEMAYQVAAHAAAQEKPSPARLRMLLKMLIDRNLVIGKALG